MNTRPTRQGTAGFTLLEVLVAISIVSIVGLYLVQATGSGLTQVAETAWHDNAARLGRQKLSELVRNGIKGSAQGAFAPDHPHIAWTAQALALKDVPGRHVRLSVHETQGQKRYELILEQIVHP